MSKYTHAEELAYFRKNLFGALKVPKKFLADPFLDEDYWVTRWHRLDAAKVEEVFPGAEVANNGDDWAFSYRDDIGNRQFIVWGENGTTVASHGSHTLSMDQHARLTVAGAEFY